MIRNVATGEHYRWGEGCDGWRLVDGSDLSLIQERIPPRGGEVRHFHTRARQVFFVLRGELQIERGDQLFRLGAEDSLEMPPGEPHRVWNAGDADVIFLVVSAPNTSGDRTNVEP